MADNQKISNLAKLKDLETQLELSRARTETTEARVETILERARARTETIEARVETILELARAKTKTIEARVETIKALMKIDEIREKEACEKEVLEKKP